ncbi:glycosyltransferase family 4 protein [Candidatus Woesearchaeota archaeon]|nr:glycosyltransferase family 4 protein [Candidatus Woesearchaeota archaeon]
MKISFVDDEPEIFPIQYGGKARTIINLARAFAELPAVEKVSILSRTIKHPSQEFVCDKIHFKKLGDYKIVRQILDEASSCDVLNVHACSFTMPYLSGLDTVITYHLHDVIFATADAGSHLDKAMGNRWSAVISPSQFASKTLTNLWWWSEQKDRVITVPRGIDFSQFYAVSNKDALEAISKEDSILAERIKHSYPIIFFPHRYEANKGEEFLEEVHEKLISKYSNPLIFATSANTKTNTSQIAEITWVNTGFMKYYYSLSDVSMVLSKAPEAFSQVPLESIACGTPVVAFRFGNLANLIDEIPSIYDTKPTSEEISNTICILLENKEKCERDMVLSQALVKERYNLTNVAGQMLNVYKKLPKVSALGKPTQITNFVREKKRFFTAPTFAMYGGDVFMPTIGGILKKHCLSSVESDILTFCESVTSHSELYHKFGNDEATTKTVENLVNLGLLIEG